MRRRCGGSNWSATPNGRGVLALLRALLWGALRRSSTQSSWSWRWAAVDTDRAIVRAGAAAAAEASRPFAAPAAAAGGFAGVLETVRLDLPGVGEDRAGRLSAMVQIREEITDEVETTRPGKLFRRQFIRPVYASPSRQCPPRVAALPARVVPGGQVGAGLVAHVVMSKFVDHLPVYRQERMLERLGPAFTRQTMGQWIEHAALLLQSVATELRAKIRQSGFQQMDETPIAVLDPERPGAARDGWLWVSHAPGESTVCFEFHLTRSHAHTVGDGCAILAAFFRPMATRPTRPLWPRCLREKSSTLIVGPTLGVIWSPHSTRATTVRHRFSSTSVNSMPSRPSCVTPMR